MSKDKIEVNMNVYDIPILVEALEEANKEIERLKDDNKYLNKVNIELSSEKNRLKSIIKEVREILNQDKASASFNTAERNALEILDKVGVDKD